MWRFRDRVSRRQEQRPGSRGPLDALSGSSSNAEQVAPVAGGIALPFQSGALGPPPLSFWVRRLRTSCAICFYCQCEDAMIVGNGQETAQLLCQPTTALGGPAAGTVTIAAGTESEMRFLTGATTVDIGPQLGQPTGRQPTEHPPGARAQLGALGRRDEEGAQVIPQRGRRRDTIPVLGPRTERVHRSFAGDLHAGLRGARDPGSIKSSGEPICPRRAAVTWRYRAVVSRLE
jgi:hypothetical protein